MSRFSDVLLSASSVDPTPLPIVDWHRIGVRGPRQLEFVYGGPNGELPKVDVVVVTWTTAEWSALDHVFLNSNGTRLPSIYDWQRGWYLYTRLAPPIPPPPPPLAFVSGPGLPPASQVPTAPPTTNVLLLNPPMPPPPLWGSYALVEVESQAGQLRVLLFKSNSHLAHPPGLSALAEMTAQIIKEAEPRFLYSIGTAGGARADQNLGDVVITNAATIQLQDPINSAYFDWTGQTFASDWFPSTDRVAAARKQLQFSLSNVVTYPALQSLVAKLHQQVPGSDAITLEDVLNDALLPEGLHESQVLAMRDVPLLTTDYYFIADSPDTGRSAFLEMDDAVLAKVAIEMGVKCCFVRNISDPIVPSNDDKGAPLPPAVRKRWSGLIYESYGFYSSVNGAIATWATLAGMK